MPAPIVFPLLVIGGGIVALLASRKSAATSYAPHPALPPSGAEPSPAPPSPAPVAPGPTPILPGGPVTLPPITITGTPSGGSGVPPWTSDLRVPSSLRSIPGLYAANSPETLAIQQALNNWIASVNAPIAPLTEDGSYGPVTQRAAAAFQVWQNANNPAANLTIDGLAGPETQNFLLDFGPMTSGAY